MITTIILITLKTSRVCRLLSWTEQCHYYSHLQDLQSLQLVAMDRAVLSAVTFMETASSLLVPEVSKHEVVWVLTRVGVLVHHDLELLFDLEGKTTMQVPFRPSPPIPSPRLHSHTQTHTHTHTQKTNFPPMYSV